MNSIEEQQNTRKNKGITLIALIATIVVSSIMAATALSLIFNRGSILEKVFTAREKYFEESQNENLPKLEKEMSNYLGMRDGLSENDVINIINRMQNQKHQSITSSLFTVYYSSSAYHGAATRSISNFLDNITKAPEMNEYLEYDETNKKVICKKDGQYVLNLSARCMRYSGDGALTGCIKINDTTVDWVDTWANSNNTEVQTMNIMTVYLKENDVIDFNVYNGFTMQYLTLKFTIHAN